MKTLRSYVCGEWHEAEEGARFATLVNPSTEEEIARASSAGIDFEKVLEHARSVGGPALRAMTFAERGAMLKAMSKALMGHRDELLALSAKNNGTTAPDGSFDIDGGSGTFSYYAFLSRKLGDRQIMVEDDSTSSLSKDGGFGARHFLVPKQGVAVCINAFNFPVWGFAEKAACALLAGVPVIAKPATATALVTERAVEILVESGMVPGGAFQCIIGSTGDLLSHLGPQDVFAFTGSAATALKLRGGENLLSCSTAVNIEADSLNAAVMGPDVESGSETEALFIKEIAREMTQKTGQKCTAIRRIFVPAGRIDEVRQALSARLSKTIVGDPTTEGVRMGPVASKQQLDDTIEGIQALTGEARIVHGTGERINGSGAPEGKGYFVGPTLLQCDDPDNASVIHEREVFAPVATVMPYDGTAGHAARLVAKGGGTLVTAVYSDHPEWIGTLISEGGPSTGRMYVGSAESAGQTTGSGAALPQTIHGGPGRAGGGEELGGLRGVKVFMQRVAVQGGPTLIGHLTGEGGQEA